MYTLSTLLNADECSQSEQEYSINYETNPAYSSTTGNAQSEGLKIISIMFDIQKNFKKEPVAIAIYSI